MQSQETIDLSTDKSIRAYIDRLRSLGNSMQIIQQKLIEYGVDDKKIASMIRAVQGSYIRADKRADAIRRMGVGSVVFVIGLVITYLTMTLNSESIYFLPIIALLGGLGMALHGFVLYMLNIRR